MTTLPAVERQIIELKRRLATLERLENKILAAAVYNDANISINDSTNTDLTFNTERKDTYALHDTGSNTDNNQNRQSSFQQHRAITYKQAVLFFRHLFRTCT